MKIFVKVKPRAKRRYVERINDSHFEVSVLEPPIEGRANFAVLEALSEYLGIPISNFRIVSGRHSKEKIIEIV